VIATSKHSFIACCREFELKSMRGKARPLTSLHASCSSYDKPWLLDNYKTEELRPSSKRDALVKMEGSAHSTCVLIQKLNRTKGFIRALWGSFTSASRKNCISRVILWAANLALSALRDKLHMSIFLWKAVMTVLITWPWLTCLLFYSNSRFSKDIALTVLRGWVKLWRNVAASCYSLIKP
jgi:hypothetical protein